MGEIEIHYIYALINKFAESRYIDSVDSDFLMLRFYPRMYDLLRVIRFYSRVSSSCLLFLGSQSSGN